VSYDKLLPENIAKYSIWCNATSVGMYPNGNETLLNLKVFQGLNLTGVVVFDTIFNPTITKLQVWAKKKGATLAYGIDMMVYQGILAFEYWTGKKVSERTAKKAVDILMKYE
jgi:shikimate dehydrogenase